MLTANHKNILNIPHSYPLTTPNKINLQFMSKINFYVSRIRFLFIKNKGPVFCLEKKPLRERTPENQAYRGYVFYVKHIKTKLRCIRNRECSILSEKSPCGSAPRSTKLKQILSLRHTQICICHMYKVDV